jgi:uncharacterized repeat protein (TIGR03803 family)
MDYWKTICFASALLAAAAIPSSAQTLTTLLTFNGANGAGPQSALIQGTDGNFYGTTSIGGDALCEPPNGCGTVFKVTPGGTLTTLHTFCRQAGCDDGANPYGALVLGTDGNFYGTTGGGGLNGLGTIFRITPQGKFTALYSGAGGTSTLIQASDGNLYGTAGGGEFGAGIIFKITPQGNLTTLYNFCALSGCADGSDPQSGLVWGTDGNLYGTTYNGGHSGAGTVYKLSPTGHLTTLHSFGSKDGVHPIAALVQASNGDFYGSTFFGGRVMYVCSIGCGTVFSINSAGSMKTLETFDWSDGAQPEAALIQATDGNLYGTTADGLGAGTIFNITPAGALTLLYGFYGGPSGSQPYGGLVQSTSGIFYGTTGGGFVGVDGTVFSLDVGLGPFVAFVQGSGKAGQTAQILGQGLTGTTSVTFNGVAASSFTVVSDTFMTAVVPSDATTGKVVMTTPGGALASNVSFRISE